MIMIIDKKPVRTHARNTAQRLRILAYLRSTRSHPSAEGVHAAVVKDLPSITLATVYRNLNALSEEGEVFRLKVGNSYRYDYHRHGDTHGVCDACGRIVDLDGETFAKGAVKAFDSQGFSPRSVTIILSGVCEACRRGKPARGGVKASRSPASRAYR